jgi:NADH:ubiquinone oxidoreductase subunit C
MGSSLCKVKLTDYHFVYILLVCDKVIDTKAQAQYLEVVYSASRYKEVQLLACNCSVEQEEQSLNSSHNLNISNNNN